MPRSKEGIYAQVSCRILHAQRIVALSEVDQLRYIKLWLLAVRERSAIFPGEIYGVAYIAHELRIGRAACRHCLVRIAAKKLISFLEDETVIVEDVIELHKNLDWNESHVKDILNTKEAQ